MTLRVTVALGNTKYYYGRLERLLKILEKLEADIAMEAPEQAKDGRWSYRFVTVQTPSKLRKHLRDNGRFKIIKLEDFEDGDDITKQKGKKPGR